MLEPDDDEMLPPPPAEWVELARAVYVEDGRVFTSDGEQIGGVLSFPKA